MVRPSGAAPSIKLKTMSNTLDTFEYRNEDDKAYGLAGMVISAGSLDALELIHSVSLDEDGPMVRFSEAYHHLLLPSLSPKGVWEQLRRNLYITAAMAVGNLMARSVVRDGAEVPVRLLGDLHKAMADEARDTLSLDDDETDALFDHLLRHNMKIFHNPRVRPKVYALTHRLALLRTLSQGDLAFELERL